MEKGKVSKLIFAIIMLIGLFAAMIGYVMNVIALIGTSDDALFTTMFVLRVVGIFVAPLGSILGLFG